MSINYVKMKARKKTIILGVLLSFLLIMFALFAFFSYTDAEENAAICEDVTFQYGDDEEFLIHPFCAGEELILVMSPSMDSTKLVCVEGKEKAQKVKFMRSELKTVYINTSSGSMDKINASKDKSYKEEGVMKYVDEEGNEEIIKIKSIGGRGNSSWNIKNAKPYTVKFNDKVKIFGLNASKRIEMLKNCAFAQYIAYNYAEDLKCSFSLPTELASVYLNGHFMGAYMLTNHVDIGTSSVDIVKCEQKLKKKNVVYECVDNDKLQFTSKASTPRDITGGYIIELINYPARYKRGCNGFTPDGEVFFNVKSPKYVSRPQMEYLSKIYYEMYDAILQSNGIHPKTGKKYSDYINIGSFARYYLIQEAFSNADGGIGSFFMYKDSDEKDGRFCAGPVWDMDWAYGVSSSWKYFNYPETFFLRAGRLNENNRIFRNLFQHNEFRDSVRCIYEKELYPKLRDSFLDSTFVKANVKDRRIENLRFNINLDKYFSTAQAYMQKHIDFLYRMLVEDEESKCYEVRVDASHHYSYLMFMVPKGTKFTIPEIPPYLEAYKDAKYSSLIGYFDDNGSKLSSRTQKIDSDKHYYIIYSYNEPWYKKIMNKIEQLMDCL